MDEFLNDDEYEDDFEDGTENEETSVDVQTEKEDKPYVKIIENYLSEQMKTDKGLEKNFIEGTVPLCFKYIYENARKQAENNCAMIEDSIVFKWARDFYNDGIAKKQTEEQKQKEFEISERKRKKEEKEKEEKEKKEFYEKCKKLREQAVAKGLSVPSEKDFVKQCRTAETENRILSSAGQLDLF